MTRSESKPLAFALGDVEGWKPRLSCTLTALAAISGKTPRQIHQVLKASAASYGVSIPDSFLADYKVKHWQKAIELLGGHWTELPTGYAAAKFEDRLDCYCLTLIVRSITYLQLLTTKVVDEFTNGKPMPFADVAIPETWSDFRVIKEYYVYP